MQDYYLGLDLGTGSVGWAITNMNYELIRAHGKSMWGVRLFDSANTAEERRMFRTGRRRLARRNWRLELLRNLFSEEISKVDDGFYLRMKESRYVPEDKKNEKGVCPELPYALFIDADYTDKEYHKQFPTIYHLRKWLMTTDTIPDIRFVYLGLHHIMKHRGHFLFSGNIENIKDFRETFQQFIHQVEEEELDFHLFIDTEELDIIEETLKNKNITKSAKKSKLNKALKAKTACEKALVTLFTGGTAKLSDIFGNKELDGCERPKISFSDSSYDDYAGTVEAELGEQYIIVEMAKAVYDWAVLVDILGEYETISDAKIAVYEKHKKDLLYLKRLVREDLGEDIYKKVFVITDAKLNNYCAYIGMTKCNGKKVDLAGKRCDRKDFYDFLKKTVLNKISDESHAEYLKMEMEKDTFLPRQVSKENGVIPYQVHLYELDKILNNLENCIPVIKANKEKIRKTFTFRIPYYVGPLNGVKKGNDMTNWVQRKKSGKIYPWNFEEMVDEEASAEKFIRRMTNKCTYLVNEDVLPKNSLLYSKFMVLNELNNLRINGNCIDVILKQKIYVDVFQRHRRVTQKRLKSYLVREGIIEKDADITGIDGDFKGSLTAYHDFKEKLTDSTLSETEMENIILNITLFGDDKKLLMKRLKKLYPQLTETQCKSLCTLSYQGWGRLSSRFLEGITAPAPETGEVWTIIRTMWETNDNLMQVLSEKYHFVEAIEDENSKDEITQISYDIVNQLAVSPAVKRQIWQTLQIVKEIEKIMGKAPKRIFIEMAREKRESKRTDSRKKTLIELYKKCREEERDWISELNHTEDSSLRGDKLYLYYVQKGRCMYSGEPIELEDLWDNRKYDIDHIYPQSKVMDDSLDNRVLVKKIYNAEKSDSYPIKKEIRDKMKNFWYMLLQESFISKEKYKRLTRATEFEPSELAGFIARQLVETRQGTKAVASLLKQIFPDTKVVYSKAKIASQFRQDFKFIKVREMNDLHHAKDAYINIVVGNTYYTKFTDSPIKFMEKHPGRSYNLKKMFTSDKDVERNGVIAWKAGNTGTIQTVREVMAKNNVLVTRRSYQVKGGLFDQQLMKKGKGQVPVKGNDERLGDIKKYGGYNKATGAYFMLVESEDKKGNKIRTIEYIPLYLCEFVEQSEKNALQYLEGSDHNLKNPKILISKIKIDTLFKVDGFYMWLSGRTSKQLIFKNANQLILSPKDTRTLKKIMKFVARKQVNKNVTLKKADGIDRDDLIQLYDELLYKIANTVYNVKLSAQKKNLSNGRAIFLELEDEEKCIVLAEILHMFQCQSGAANLKLINGSGKAGIITLGINITGCKQISIINQSPTGIFEKEIDLKKI